MNLVILFLLINNYLHFTQVQLAYLSGTTQNTISSIESGAWYPNLYLALILSYVLEFNVRDLFDLEFINFS